MRPTSLPFSRMQTDSSRPASAASCFRRIAALRPAGPAPTMTTSYCIDSRRSFSSRRGGNTIQLDSPANSLTIASMPARKSTWAGNRIDRHCRAAKRLGLVARCRRRCRRARGAARLAEAARPADAPVSRGRTEPAPTSSPSARGARRVPRLARDRRDLPLAGKEARRVLPHGPEQAEIMLFSDAPDGGRCQYRQPIGGEAWQLTEKMLAAIGSTPARPIGAWSACFYAPGKRMSAGERDLAPKSPAATSACPSQADPAARRRPVPGAARQAARGAWPCP